MSVHLNFAPSPEVTAVLNALLTIYERRELLRRDDNARRQAVRVKLDEALATSYFSQTDPAPRQNANAQLSELERASVVALDWVRGEKGHLLAGITLHAANAEAAYGLLGRTSLAAKRKRLLDRLLAERSRLALLMGKAGQPTHEWPIRALGHALHQLREGLSPAPFSLTNQELNEDLLAALSELPNYTEETPQRVFSVRTFNDSKRFEQLAPKIATLAKRGHPPWRSFKREEVLRELNVVANPNHLFLFGDWELIDRDGQVLALGAFEPSVGLPAAQAAHLQTARVSAPRIICVENLTSFNELVRTRNASQPFAALCLAGNPSPACRHLLRCLPRSTPVQVWADLDYGGFNILAQIRAQVNASAQPVWMDAETFEAGAMFARPLQPNDIKRLNRLLQHPLLEDARPAIAHLLARGLKLEQEAIRFDAAS